MVVALLMYSIVYVLTFKSERTSLRGKNKNGGGGGGGGGGRLHHASK